MLALVFGLILGCVWSGISPCTWPATWLRLAWYRLFVLGLLLGLVLDLVSGLGLGRAAYTSAFAWSCDLCA